MIFTKKKREMLERLRKMGVTSEDVLAAMNRVERHLFVAPGLEFQAYDEKALPIGYGQTISHPFTVALMTQTLDIKKGQKVLEIGTGSGYQAAILCQMGARVYTIELERQLGQKAARKLRECGYHFLCRIGDGALGWENYAPYDAIIVTAGAPVTPEALKNQLKESGKLLIPVGSKEKQILTLYVKDKDQLNKTELTELKFVPLIGTGGW